jgi:hypothetical protein
LPVGKEFAAQVVRSGRRPGDYATVYDELASVVWDFGYNLDGMDPSEIIVRSVETAEGPGFMVSVKHRIEDEGVGPVPPV